MAKRLPIVLALLLWGVTARAATMLDVTGPSPFGFANQQILVLGWSQAATYNNVVITAPLRDETSGGPIAGIEGVVYLVNAIGPGATVANLVAPPVSISGLTATFATVPLFSGLTLGPGSYYLVFASTNTNPLSMSMEGSSTPVVTPGAGITSLGGDSSLTVPPFPPNATVSLSQPTNLFVSVTGDFVSFAPATIPTLPVWGLSLLGVGLLFIGVFALRGHAAP